MGFTLQTLDQWVKKARDLISGLIPDADLTPGSDYFNDTQILGSMAWQITGQLAFAVDQIFPGTAAVEFLQRHANLYGLPRKPAVASVGSALILGLNGASQPAGTTLTSNGGVALLTTGVATVGTPAWTAKTVRGFDPTRPSRLVLSDTTGMAIGDPFSIGGTDYAIKDLPGGAAIIIFGEILSPDTVLKQLVLPIAGVVVATVAVLSGAAGNLPFATPMAISGPAANITPTAIVMEQAAGAGLEDPVPWARRIQGVKAERPGGGNRSQYQAWAEGMDDLGITIPTILGVDRAFVYDLFRGLGTGDVVAQGVSGARHLSVARLTQLQNFVAPNPPTDANPGKAMLGGMDVKITDFIDQQQDVAITLFAGPGFGADWQGTLPIGAGSTLTRVVTLTSPIGIVVPGNRIAVRVGPDSLLEMQTVVGVDAGGINVSPGFDFAPLIGETVFPGSSLIIPVRDALLAMFDDLGPGDTNPPTRYPAPTTIAPAALELALIIATVMDVKGVINMTIQAPILDVVPLAKTQVTPGKLTILHG